MRELLAAIGTFLGADTLSSPIVSIVGAAVTLASGQGESWSKGMVANLGGTNAPRTATVVGVAGDVVTLDSATWTAPGGSSTLRAGVRQWVRPGGSGGEQYCYVEPLPDLDPAKFLEGHADPACVLKLRCYGGTSRSQARERWDLEARILGHDGEWMEGLERRMRQRLDLRPSAISVAAHDVWQLEVGRGERVEPMKASDASGKGAVLELSVPLTAVVSLART